MSADKEESLKKNVMRGPFGAYFIEDFKRDALGGTVLEEAIESIDNNLIFTYLGIREANGVKLFIPERDVAILGFVPRGERTVYLNKTGLSEERQVYEMYQASVKSGYHVAGTDAASVLAHESGHVAHNILIDRYPKGNKFLGQIVSEKNTIIDIIVVEAAKAANRATSQDLSVDEWAGKISRYACANRRELIADAFCDFYTHGDRATPFSREIGRIFREELTI